MRNHPKVLYVDYSSGFGGAIKSLALTLRGLPKADSAVLTTQDRELTRLWFAGHTVRSFRRLVNYRNLSRVRRAVGGAPAPFRWVVSRGLAVVDVLVTLRNAAALAVHLRGRRVALVHLNNGFVPREALWAVRVTRTPCVVHLRDFIHDPRQIPAWAARHVARVVAVSDAVADSVRGAGFPAERVTTVHDPVDLDAVEGAAEARARVRARCGLRDGDVAVGIFGRVIPWKGQMEFVRALITAMAADPRVRGVIVGDESDGGPEYFARVRAAMREAGVEDRFVLAGYQAEVEAYYWAMDVVVHASVTPEPFGMVVPEAMAAGRAVIAADAGGPREVVTHGEDGLLVPASDVPRLAAAILLLASDAGLRARMGERARATARRRFDIPTNARAVERVYASVLAGAAPAPRPLAARLP